MKVEGENMLNKDVRNIENRVEMFIDTWLIDKMDGVSLKLHKPEKREVVLMFDRIWEGNLSCYVSVFKDGDNIRMYYRGSSPSDISRDQVTCYAESCNGIDFTKPSLGLYEFEGSKENNIVLKGKDSHNFAPFKDQNPNCNALQEQRYKAIGGLPPEGLTAYCSGDGIRWSKMQEEPIITKGELDSHNIAFWDTEKKIYRCYSRYFQQVEAEDVESDVEGFVRAIQSFSSENFIDWSDPVPNIYRENVPWEHFYTNSTVQCPGAPHIYLSFPKRFLPKRKKVKEHPLNGVSDAVFMSSRDGIHWERTFLEAWVRPGLDIRNWTDRNNMVAWGIVQTSPDEFSMYISEHYRMQDARLRRMTIRRHGFGSVNAGWKEGNFVTHPLIFKGKQLILNYSTSAAGYIKVELRDENNQTIPGYGFEDMDELYGDELDHIVCWKNNADIIAFSGRPVRFAFKMKDADIFALCAR